MSLSAKETYKIFIGGLTIETTEAQIEECFSKFGFVYDILIIRHRDSGLSKGYGFITCNSIKTYQRIVSSEHTINGRAIDCHSSFKKSDDPEKFKENANKKIFVGGISMETNDDDLYNYFSQFGTIRQAYVIKDPVTRRSKKFGFAIMRDQDSVDAVLAKDAHVIKGVTASCKLFVRYTEEEAQKKLPSTDPDKEFHNLVQNSLSGSTANADPLQPSKIKKYLMTDSRKTRKTETSERSEIDHSRESNSGQNKQPQGCPKAVQIRKKNQDLAPVYEEGSLPEHHSYLNDKNDGVEDSSNYVGQMDQAYCNKFSSLYSNNSKAPIWPGTVPNQKSKVTINDDTCLKESPSHQDYNLYNGGVSARSLSRLHSQQLVSGNPVISMTRYGAAILAGHDCYGRIISRPSRTTLVQLETQLHGRSQPANYSCYHFRVGPTASVLRIRN